ncbi:MAG TPA: hypothetical protein VLT47_11125 [Anaeromyxobacteraceae bacterium]|nr:hypothetical protein [Anaeromyxobacteraceae bacterium]
MAKKGEPLRMWSALFGMGDLVWELEGNKFTPDDKTRKPIEFNWTRAGTGMGQGKPPKKAEKAEWDEWVFFITRAGELLLFRRNAPPPSASSPPDTTSPPSSPTG